MMSSSERELLTRVSDWRDDWPEPREQDCRGCQQPTTATCDAVIGGTVRVRVPICFGCWRAIPPPTPASPETGGGGDDDHVAHARALKAYIGNGMGPRIAHLGVPVIARVLMMLDVSGPATCSACGGWRRVPPLAAPSEPTGGGVGRRLAHAMPGDEEIREAWREAVGNAAVCALPVSAGMLRAFLICLAAPASPAPAGDGRAELRPAGDPHETTVTVETDYHPSGDEYTVAIADCDSCEWTDRGDESDVRSAAWMHELEHAPADEIEEAHDALTRLGAPMVVGDHKHGEEVGLTLAQRVQWLARRGAAQPPAPADGDGMDADWRLLKRRLGSLARGPVGQTSMTEVRRLAEDALAAAKRLSALTGGER